MIVLYSNELKMIEMIRMNRIIQVELIEHE